jgi:hypothetical protein
MGVLPVRINSAEPAAGVKDKGESEKLQANLNGYNKAHYDIRKAARFLLACLSILQSNLKNIGTILQR